MFIQNEQPQAQLQAVAAPPQKDWRALLSDIVLIAAAVGVVLQLMGRKNGK